jgi:hypothetical protein
MEYDIEKSELSGAELILAGFANAETVLAGKKGSSINAPVSKYRADFLQRLKEMPKEIQEGLLNGKLQLSDVVIYGTRDNGSDTVVDIFKTDDSISVGITNIDRAALPAERPMTLSAIKLLLSDAVTASFNSIAYTPDFSRGEFELRYNSMNVIERMPILGSFAPAVAGYDINKPYGLYELTNPKVILGGSGKRIEAKIFLPAALTDTTTATKVMLIGCTVVPFSK